MDADEITRFIRGLIKKHGTDFSVRLKYRTAGGKVRKRHGRYVALKDDFELVLYNQDKRAEGRYLLTDIVDIGKMDSR
jgi:hypothetical protein